MNKTWTVPDWVGPDVIVVGTDNYRVAYPKKDGAKFDVTIVREPKNAYDKNALAVQYRGKTFGYISAARAEKLSPVLDKAKVTTISSRAESSVGSVGSKHVHVAMISLVPDLQHALGLPEDPSPLRFTIKAAKKHLASYEALCKSGEDRARHLARITTEITPSGKYAGQPIYYFWVKNKCIGEASARYRDENLAFYRALETGTTKAEVELCIFKEGGPWGKATVLGHKVRTTSSALLIDRPDRPEKKGILSRIFGK